MKQYIDKNTLVAEIERIKKEECPIDTYEGRIKLFYFEQFFSFLDTLEVKEVKNFIWNNARTTIPEDSTNQIICIKEDGLAVSTIGKIVNGTVKWAYLDDLLNTNSFNVEVKKVEEKFECPNIPKQEWSEEDERMLHTKFYRILEYFWHQLDIDPDNIEFNLDDLKQLL